MNEEQLLEHLRRMKATRPLQADLWPRMEQRLHQQSPRFTHWDWAIAAGAAAAVCLYPELAAILLYNF